MTAFDAPLPPGLQDPSALRPYFEECLREPTCDTGALYEALHEAVCAYASAGIAVERALAIVNAELRAVLMAVGEDAPGKARVQAIRDLAMDCVLDCYYPDEPRRTTQRVSA